MRVALGDPESARFPFFDDMRAEGVTDYIALPLLFTDGSESCVELDHETAGRLHRSAADRAAVAAAGRWPG